jgi:7-cyano-7-deazaguanine synthase
MKTAVVLFSGGQDSTTCLYLALTLFDRVHALSINYGQRHALELQAAREIAARAGVPHHEVQLPAFGELVGHRTALVRPEFARSEQPALAGEGGIVDAAMPQGLPTSFVPGRNALLLTLAASYAATLDAKDVMTGVCQTDYSGYPDCREEFMVAMQGALTLAMPSSLRPMRLHTPLMHLTKAETVTLARRLPGAWESLALSVTCYDGKRPGCGVCPSCTLRLKGFAEAGEVDPGAGGRLRLPAPDDGHQAMS